MKFYDIDALEHRCGTGNKYKITALVAARARWLSERKTVLDALPVNEKYLSEALLEIENGVLPANWVEELQANAASAETASAEDSHAQASNG